jgi:hypothetical protein
MLKRHLTALMIALALTLATVGASTIVADALGFSLTSQAQACNGQGSGGGC